MSLTSKTHITVRVGLLISDAFTRAFAVETFERWLKNALPPGSTAVLKMLPYNVFENEFPTSEEVGTFFDVIMVTGNIADAFGDDPWIRQLLSLIQHVYNKYPNVKLFGIGFGHQIISRALGAAVARGTKLEFGSPPIRLTHVGKSVFGVDSLELQQIHQDHVPIESLSDYFSPGRIYLLGSSDPTPNQGFVQIQERCTLCEQKGPVHQLQEHIHILTVQGHPELTGVMRGNIFRHRVKKGAIRDRALKSYLGEGGASKSLPTETESKEWFDDYDGGDTTVGRVFWKMFGVKYDT